MLRQCQSICLHGVRGPSLRSGRRGYNRGVQVVDGIHEITYGFVQSYLVEDGDRLTLIDTGVANQADAVLEAIAGIGRQPGDLREIVLTHGHVDHTGSAADLAEHTGATVLAHSLDAQVIRGEAVICPPILSDLERPYAEEAASRVVPSPPCPVDRELGDGDRLDIAGGARVMHLPGHTPGSIAIYLQERRILFCGDAVASLNGRPIVGFFNCDPDQARESFLGLAEIDVDVACFGHGTALVGDASASFRRLARHLARR